MSYILVHSDQILAEERKHKAALRAYGVIVVIAGAVAAFIYGLDLIDVTIAAIDAELQKAEKADSRPARKPQQKERSPQPNYTLEILVASMFLAFWLLVCAIGVFIFKRRSWSLNAAWLCGLVSMIVLAFPMSESFPPRLSPAMAIPLVLIVPPWLPILRRGLRPAVGYGESET
jgi:amino acid transporter